MNLTAFKKSSYLDSNLIAAVVRQSGGWPRFQEIAHNVACYGANCGFTGWIWHHTETVPFAVKHKSTILSTAEQLADDLGEGDAYQMISRFNCLQDLELTPGKIAALIHGRKPTDDDTHADYVSIFNALAWFALEEVCASYLNILEEQDGE